jgi:hypothetical protein
MVKNDGSSDWPEVDQPFETEVDRPKLTTLLVVS